MSLPVPLRYARLQVMIIPQPDDIDYDCVPVTLLPRVTPLKAIREHEQEEFLTDIYKPQPMYGVILFRRFIVWSSSYVRRFRGG